VNKLHKCCDGPDFFSVTQTAEWKQSADPNHRPAEVVLTLL